MFGLLKEKEVLFAPVEGKTVSMSEVSDPTFGKEILGKGIAIIPSVGKVYAPTGGTVEMVFDTKHAISMCSESGIQILIHVGLDTVTLKGKSFTAYVDAGQKVKAGDLMLEFDIQAIKDAGLETITPLVICNSDDYKKITGHVGKDVHKNDKVLTLVK